VLPTRMILPTGTTASSTPIVAAAQPTRLPPTPVPSEAAALQPTTVAPTPTLQPSAPPAAQPVFASPLSAQPVPNQITIQFAPGTAPEQQQAYVQQIGGQIEQRIAPLDTVVVTLPDDAALPPSPLVLQTEPDYYVYAQQSAPNDPFYSQQWAMPVIRAPEAWPLLPATTPTITVAVIDSGICATHPDLVGRIVPGYDFVQNDTTPQDEYGHGCEVSGIIAANRSNALGIAGVAPNTQIMPVRVLDSAGSGTYSNVAAAITYATDNGAQIINLSLGGSVPSTTLENAINYAVVRGVLLVAAAGNGGSANPAVIYPAAYADVVAVASVDSNLQLSSFSSYGPEVDLLAPGRDIMTTTLNGSYAQKSGTSFAAPQVAGIAALELAQGRQLTQGGGLAQVYIPAPPTVTPQPGLDKHGNVIPLVAENQPVPTDTWAVILDAGSDPNAVAAQLGYENLGQIGTLADTYLFRALSSGSSLAAAQEAASALQASAQVVWFEQQFAQQQYTRTPDDEPLYTSITPNEQWHLRNDNGAVNLNLPPGWVSGSTTGAGVQIAIVDDGLQYVHPDLAPNYNPTGSCDYNGSAPLLDCNDADPAPTVSGSCSTNADCHGTAVGGVAAAADNPAPTFPDDWDFCGVGVAYGAQLAGIRLVSTTSTLAQEAAALVYQNNINDIYNNSWGPSDSGAILAPLDTLGLIQTALSNSVNNGRGGLGSIYVWAAGNGRANGDNVNADGYANSRYVIAVGATNSSGRFAPYSEPGASMLVTAPSSGGTQGIATTDLIGQNGYNTSGGNNDYSFPAVPVDQNYTCTRTFGGTSASTPMVSGVVALMLQANPNLTWRDVQHILVETAQQNDNADSDWQVNGAGRDINHNYGFGMVDATAAVNAAQTWTNVAPEISAESDSDPNTSGVQPTNVNVLIPDNNANGLSSSITLATNIYVEHVEVVFNATHSYRGDLEVILTSPDGTQSRLMEERPLDGSSAGYSNWSFTSVRHWGEHAAGTWTLKVADREALDQGTFQNWRLIVYGTAAPPKQPAPVAPANPATITTGLPWGSVNFSWTMADVYADTIQLQLDTVNPPVTTYDLAGTAANTTRTLPLGTYYWRVRAVDDDPATTEPAWDTIEGRTFTVATSNTVAPQRNYFTSGAPTLTWKALTWATGYQVEISTSATFAAGATVHLTPQNPPIPADEPFFLVDPPLPADGVYYWRVRARKADGTWSATWSAADSFVVDVPP